jgi:CRP-like cAMP-binding protein
LAFLKDIEKDKLILMASQFKWITLDKDGYLFERGHISQDGNGLHFLLEGSVKVLVLDDGQEKVVAVVQKGQFFGEVGLVIQLPRTATVIARKKCLFLELSQSNFRNFVQIVPEVLEAFKEKLEEYNIPLRYLIHNPILQDFLNKYLESEQSAENLVFWLKVKDFRLSDKNDPEEIRDEAQKIYDEYIKSLSLFSSPPLFFPSGSHPLPFCCFLFRWC